MIRTQGTHCCIRSLLIATHPLLPASIVRRRGESVLGFGDGGFTESAPLEQCTTLYDALKRRELPSMAERRCEEVGCRQEVGVSLRSSRMSRI